MSYQNYRNSMPHYNSMPYNCDPMSLGFVPGMPPYGSSMLMKSNNFSPMTYMPLVPEDYVPDMPFIPETEMNSMLCMPQMPNGTMPPYMPSMPQMPEWPDGDMPAMPAMPGDSNYYPDMQMPYMNNSTMPTPMTCEQLMEMMKRMNCMEQMNNMYNNINKNTNK